MKIAIITLPLHINYGGILQCYALQTVLQRMGHEVHILNKPRYGRLYLVEFIKSYLSSLYKLFVNKKNGGDIVSIYDNLYEYEYISKDIKSFIRKNINTYTKRNWNQKVISKFDVFIVGSDQVWRPLYTPLIERMFLSFTEGYHVKRLSYAASFGIDNISEFSDDKLKKCSLLLKQFDAVSVREKSGIELCKKYFGIDARQVVDPTLLLVAEDYYNLFSKLPKLAY